MTTTAHRPEAEGDETPARADNSLGRLLALSDGVFAIAMTLLALDLRVPDLGEDPTAAAFARALAADVPSYLSFLVSFYIVARYWVRHRTVMKAVSSIHPALIQHTILLLLVVAALPFPASLLGRYASQPLSLVVYGAVNVVAVGTLLVLSHDVRRFGLVDDADRDPESDRDERAEHVELWATLAVFVLLIPAGFGFGGRGAVVLVLLVLIHRVSVAHRWWRHRHPVAAG